MFLGPNKLDEFLRKKGKNKRERGRGKSGVVAITTRSCRAIEEGAHLPSRSFLNLCLSPRPTNDFVTSNSVPPAFPPHLPSSSHSLAQPNLHLKRHLSFLSTELHRSAARRVVLAQQASESTIKIGHIAPVTGSRPKDRIRPHRGWLHTQGPSGRNVATTLPAPGCCGHI